MKSYTTKSVPNVTGGDDGDFQAKQDAETLQKHAEIHADPQRLKAATKHLASQKANLDSAHSDARQTLMAKTGKRMKAAFGKNGPEDDGETPFQKAGSNYGK